MDRAHSRQAAVLVKTQLLIELREVEKGSPHREARSGKP